MALILFLFNKVAKVYFKQPLADADKDTVRAIQETGIDISTPVSVLGTTRQRVQDIESQQKQRMYDMMNTK